MGAKNALKLQTHKELMTHKMQTVVGSKTMRKITIKKIFNLRLITRLSIRIW